MADKIPVLTSNAAPYGWASASSSFSLTCYPWKAMDDDNSTWWSTTAAGKDNCWLMYDWGPYAPMLVTSFTVRARSGAGNQAGAPKNFKLQGYNGSTYTDLCAPAAQTAWGDGEQRTFSFSNSTLYRGYRLFIVDNNGGTYTEVAEFELLCDVPLVRIELGGVVVMCKAPAAQIQLGGVNVMCKAPAAQISLGGVVVLWDESGSPPERAINPYPPDSQIAVAVDTQLSWDNGGGATSYDVYFGTTSGALTKVSSGQAGTMWDPPGDLEYSRTYYWRIDSINEYGTTAGDEWSCTTADAPVSQTEPYLLPFPATLPFRETLSFLTQIIEGADGSEQRIAHRGGIPRQSFLYSLLCRTEDQSIRLTHMLHAWLKWQLAVPVWAEAEKRTTPLAAGATSIAFDTQYADYRVGSRAVVYQDPDHAELVTISAVAADGLTIDPGLVGDYNGVHFVMPCRVGYVIGSAQRERFANGASIVELSLEVQDNIAITGWTPALTYDGYDVLTDPAWLTADTFRESHDGDAVLIDAGVGTFKVISTSDFNVVAQDHGFVNDTKATAWLFRQWLHALVGRQKAFLVPTFRPDFTLTRACGATDTSIYVRNLGRAAYLGLNALRTYLAFRPPAATIIPRKIVGTAPIGSAEERIDLNTAPGQAFGPGAELCWLDRCRLASDTIEIQWYRRGKNFCQTQLVRVQE